MKKPQSFKLVEETKTIIIYTNVEQGAEQNLITFYLGQGYKPMMEVKKKGKTVAQMRNDLAEDKETLAKFNAAYDKKGGFHTACKIYAEWKKAQK